ncbi:unnamed protein product, partial [Urochloa humidicola]
WHGGSWEGRGFGRQGTVSLAGLHPTSKLHPTVVTRNLILSSSELTETARGKKRKERAAESSSQAAGDSPARAKPRLAPPWIRPTVQPSDRVAAELLARAEARRCSGKVEGRATIAT